MNIISDLSIHGYSSNPIPAINHFPLKTPRKWMDRKIMQNTQQQKKKHKKALKTPQTL